jgi:Flp pilus assembly protein TadG
VRRRLRREDGVALVEFALVGPVLLLLVMGLLEFGLAWRDSLTISTTARAGARIGSQLGNDRLSDYEILKGMQAAVADIPNASIQQLVVYKSATADGSVPAACTASGSQAGVCNVYTPADFARPSSDFAGANSCSTGSPDIAWCPTTRETRQSVGTDYLGVYVRVRRTFITGLFPGGITINDNTVMRVEPRPE